MLTEHDDGTVTMDEKRLQVCLEVAWELDALAMALPGVAESAEVNSPHLVVRGIAGRIKQLAGVLMSGLDDCVEQSDDLRCTVEVTQEKAGP